MFTMFLVCALLGGTVFICQFVLAVVGAGADDLDLASDIPDDLDIPDDVGDVAGQASHGSTWLFGVISFRTIVAALTFFGLAGLTALEANLSQALSLLVAIGAGAVAMYGVHYLMQLLFRLRQDGTARIERTVGQRATVYIPIPANNAGAGKVQMRTQGRIIEYAAKTSAPEKLATGTTVEVVAVLTPTTLEVEPVIEPAAAEGSSV
jgi:membrane protein implicated in regulation of membrane protease activity